MLPSTLSSCGASGWCSHRTDTTCLEEAINDAYFGETEDLINHCRNGLSPVDREEIIAQKEQVERQEDDEDRLIYDGPKLTFPQDRIPFEEYVISDEDDEVDARAKTDDPIARSPEIEKWGDCDISPNSPPGGHSQEYFFPSFSPFEDDDEGHLWAFNGGYQSFPTIEVDGDEEAGSSSNGYQLMAARDHRFDQSTDGFSSRGYAPASPSYEHDTDEYLDSTDSTDSESEWSESDYESEIELTPPFDPDTVPGRDALKIFRRGLGLESHVSFRAIQHWLKDSFILRPIFLSKIPRSELYDPDRQFIYERNCVDSEFAQDLSHAICSLRWSDRIFKETVEEVIPRKGVFYRHFKKYPVPNGFLRRRPDDKKDLEEF